MGATDTEASAPSDASPPPFLQVHQVQAVYGRTVALRGVDLELARGKMTAVIGSNGAGKSTLLKVIGGQMRPARGTVFLEGTRLGARRPDRAVRAGIALVPEGRQVLARMTVEENLLLGAYSRRNRAEVNDDLGRSFQRFPVLERRRRQQAGTLSGGEQQILAIGRALMSRPKILLLDEPSLGLAPLMVQEVLGLVSGLQAEGLTVALVEQNARQALRMADFAYVLERGLITLSGPGSALLADPRVVDAYLGGDRTEAARTPTDQG